MDWGARREDWVSVRGLLLICLIIYTVLVRFEAMLVYNI